MDASFEEDKEAVEDQHVEAEPLQATLEPSDEEGVDMEVSSDNDDYDIRNCDYY